MSHLRPLICAVGLVSLSAVCLGDDPRLDKFEADARQLLGEVAKVYRERRSIDWEGELTSIATTGDGKVRKQAVPLIVRFSRPDKMVLVNGPVRMSSEGKTLHSVVEPFKQYSASEAPKTLTFDTLKPFPAIGPLFGGLNGFPMFLLFGLATEDDAATMLATGASGMKLEADREIDGKPHRCLFVDWPRGTGYRLLIEPETKTIARIEMVHAAETVNENAPRGKSLRKLEIRWTANAKKADQPARDGFAFQPPNGFNKVDQDQVLERPLAPGEVRVPEGLDAAVLGAMEASKAMVGKPSPDFNVTVLDGAGKTKTIRKNDLAGKVVVVVIWPISIGEPFPGEMRAIIAMAEGAQNAGENVAFLFIVHDNLPGDPATIREQVEADIKAKGLKLPVGEVGRVVLDPDLTIHKAFHATALPTTIVIDGKGVVRAVDPGFNEKRKETLRGEIDDALAKTPSGSPKPPKSSK